MLKGGQCPKADGKDPGPQPQAENARDRGQCQPGLLPLVTAYTHSLICPVVTSFSGPYRGGWLCVCGGAIESLPRDACASRSATSVKSPVTIRFGDLSLWVPEVLTRIVKQGKFGQVWKFACPHEEKYYFRLRGKFWG
jgi:hypothetical protein